MKVSWDDDIPNIWKNKKCSKPPARIALIFLGDKCLFYISLMDEWLLYIFSDGDDNYLFYMFFDGDEWLLFFVVDEYDFSIFFGDTISKELWQTSMLNLIHPCNKTLLFWHKYSNSRNYFFHGYRIQEYLCGTKSMHPVSYTNSHHLPLPIDV